MSLSSSSSSSFTAIIIDDDDDATDFTQVSKQQRVTAVSKHTTHLSNDEQDEKQTAPPRSTPTSRPSPLKGKKRMTKADSTERYRVLPDGLVKKKWDQTVLPSVAKKTYGDTECWESKLATQGSGYCQLQLNGSNYGTQQGFYLLHIWSMRYHKRMPADLSHLVDPDCSHLCHNKRCVNPDHLVFEEGRNNKRRNVCPHMVDGTLICPYIHHAPACLHPHSKFEEGGLQRFAGY